MVELVTIKHPDIEGTARCSRRAFDEVYAEKGWEIVPDDEGSRSATTRKKTEKGAQA